MENVFNSWKKINLRSIDNFTIYNKNISMDYFLMVSIIAKTTKNKLKNIIKAIQRPVLSIEVSTLHTLDTENCLHNIYLIYVTAMCSCPGNVNDDVFLL